MTTASLPTPSAAATPADDSAPARDGEPSDGLATAPAPAPPRPGVRVVLPHHLRTLAQVQGELLVEAGTVRQVLAALEALHPPLRGTLRDPASGQRRPFVRFFACREDLSHGSLDDALPDAVLRGDEPLLVVGAMAGG